MIAVIYPDAGRVYPVKHAQSVRESTEIVAVIPRSDWVEGQDRLLEAGGYERTGPWFTRHQNPWCEVRRVAR